MKKKTFIGDSSLSGSTSPTICHFWTFLNKRRVSILRQFNCFVLRRFVCMSHCIIINRMLLTKKTRKVDNQMLRWHWSPKCNSMTFLDSTFMATFCSERIMSKFYNLKLYLTQLMQLAKKTRKVDNQRADVINRPSAIRLHFSIRRSWRHSFGFVVRRFVSRPADIVIMSAHVLGT